MMLRLILVGAMIVPLAGRAALTWDAQELKLAARSNDKEVVGNYRFKNTGPTVVTVTDILPSCDCVTAELSQRSFAPGEEGTLKVRLAIESQALSQDETLAVTTDDTPSQPVFLRLHADIQPLIIVSPAALSWPAGTAVAEESVVAVATSPLRVAAFAVKETTPRGAAEARVETIEEGKRYRVRVRPVSNEKTLNFTISCAVGFVDGSSQEVVVYGNVRK